MNYYYSNIYWHFTGSPKNIDWSSVFRPKDICESGRSPKSDSECLKILESILTEKTLRAKSKEKVDRHIVSDPFCCVTDIPIQNLKEHKKYYGNIVIGFRHEKIHKQFNPVLYIPKKALPQRTDNLHIFIPKELGLAYSGLVPTNSKLTTVDEQQIGKYLINHFKITDFSDKPEETFYREREWRKVGDFNFKLTDIALIILPDKLISKAKKMIDTLGVQQSAIISWELLEKM